MMNASGVAQLMMRSIGGENHYMSNIVHLANPATNGSVTPTKELIEERIQEILDPFGLQALQADGSEFPADSTIYIEAAAERVLSMQEAHDAAVDAENVIHADDGLPNFGTDASRPCLRVDSTPGRVK